MNKLDLKNFAQTRSLMEYLKKQREHSKFSQYVEVGTTFFLITFFLLFAIRPTILTISSLVGEIKSKEVLSRQMRAKINSVITAQDLFSQVQESYQVVNSCLPDQPRFSQADVQIEKIAESLSLSLPGTNFVLNDQEKNPSEHIKSFSFSFNVPIDFSQSPALVDKVQSNRRLMTIDELNLVIPQSKDSGQRPESAPSGSVQLSFSPRLYYWLQ